MVPDELGNPNSEDIVMLKKLLRRYAKFSPDSRFVPLRIIVIDGHEIAWMEQRDKGGDSVFRSLCCECDFIEGMAWKICSDGRFTKIHRTNTCPPRNAALYLRHLELRKEYLNRWNGRWSDARYCLRPHISEIILDLIEKAKVGEFLEDGNGAPFWGGYFYLQTLASITDEFVGHLWEDVHRLMEEKKIGMEGMVVTPYREPPPPVWVEYAKVNDDDGWTGIAFLPGARQLAQEWKFEVLKPDGAPIALHFPGLILHHDPVFGPDVEDVARAEEYLKKLIHEAKEYEKNQSEEHEG